MLSKVGKANHVEELRRHARRLSRQAWSLLRLADTMADEMVAEDDAIALAADPFAYEHEQLLEAMALRMLRERSRRRKLFPAHLFGECSWDIILMLYRYRVQGRRATTGSFAVDLDCPVRVIEDNLKELKAEGLVEWCGRTHFVRLSDDGASRVRSFFVEEDIATEADNDTGSRLDCA